MGLLWDVGENHGTCKVRIGSDSHLEMRNLKSIHVQIMFCSCLRVMSSTPRRGAFVVSNVNALPLFLLLSLLFHTKLTALRPHNLPICACGCGPFYRMTTTIDFVRDRRTKTHPVGEDGSKVQGANHEAPSPSVIPSK